MLPHALPGEVCLRLFMGFQATPLAYTPVTVFSLRVLVPRLTWSILHSCVVSNASSLSPADAVPAVANPRLATEIVIASMCNGSVSRCLVDVNLGVKDLTSSPTLASDALLVQTCLLLGALLCSSQPECDASCNGAHRCVQWPSHALVFGQEGSAELVCVQPRDHKACPWRGSDRASWSLM